MVGEAMDGGPLPKEPTLDVRRKFPAHSWAMGVSVEDGAIHLRAGIGK
jgi:hypothetical protein